MTIIFEQILRALHVPFTKNYTREMYMQHPDRNNLLGISRLLNAYGVDNVSVLVSDKKALTKLEPPFLAEFSQDLAVVTSTTSENVEFIWRNEKLRLDVARFQESWSGVVTLLKKSEELKNHSIVSITANKWCNMPRLVYSYSFRLYC